MWKLTKGELVQLDRTEKVGKRRLAVTPYSNAIEDSRCYSWIIDNERKRKDQSWRVTFQCNGCRSLRYARGVTKDTPLPTLIAIRGADNLYRWEEIGKCSIHCCLGPRDKIVVTYWLLYLFCNMFYRLLLAE